MSKQSEALEKARAALKRMASFGNTFGYRSSEQNPYEQVCEAIAAIEALAAPPVQEPVQEQLGSVCADGGTCHHQCTERCFRRECCAPFSDYVGPWSYATAPAPAPVQEPTIQKQLDDADRRAGASERELETCRSDLARINHVRDKMKDEWGVDRNVSFDVVWDEALTLKRQATTSAAQTAPTVQPVTTLLQKSKENFEQNFGSNSYADWIYNDLAELLDISAVERAFDRLVQEPCRECAGEGIQGEDGDGFVSGVTWLCDSCNGTGKSTPPAPAPVVD